MSDDELATKLLIALTQEQIEDARLLEYACWLEEHHQSERVKAADYLVMSHDGTTHWGKTYKQALKRAYQCDRELFEAVQNLELP